MTLLLAGTVRFEADRLPAARARMQQMVLLSRAEDGCIAYAYSEDVAEPGLVHVFEVWRDQAAFDAHHATPHFLEWRASREALGMSGRDMTAYEVASSRKV